ncbi:SDR family NAD(P)-dependent oxidoreductase [Candidatus Woesearchaeota archaeon]|nr:SDR family NAD(P)-dependent oxidoreductase [Candidatus Woesearchaeota archaeon]
MEIKNKVIIITGASEGIGFSTAKHLSKKGAHTITLS